MTIEHVVPIDEFVPPVQNVNSENIKYDTFSRYILIIFVLIPFITFLLSFLLINIISVYYTITLIYKLFIYLLLYCIILTVSLLCSRQRDYTTHYQQNDIDV